MNLTDNAGLSVSGATPDSLAAFELACHELRCMVDDPLASAERALQASPTMTMAHVLKAWLLLLGTEPGGYAAAREVCDGAATLPANRRERAHLQAARALAAGRWHEAGLRLEDLSLAWPRDALALQVGHQIDFFRGDARLLRDRIARALPAWDDSMPGFHAILGMQAFGLEESGELEAAERLGRRAVALEPRDGWAWHAVAHVAEMRNRPRDGIAWLRPNRATWSTGSFLAVHNTWHLALFELELDGAEAALALYDETIAGGGLPQVLDLVDAGAMLWRLQLRGVDVGARWTAVSDRWLEAGGAGAYAFNDVHAMLAHVGADRAAAQRDLLEALREAAARDDDNGGFTREVGLPVAEALLALAHGQAAAAVARLRRVRSVGHRFGGSHAQRDLIDLTLIDAAVRAGDEPLAAALAAERLARRPDSPFARRLAARYPVGATASAAV